jgi:hypothetical protein
LSQAKPIAVELGRLFSSFFFLEELPPKEIAAVLMRFRSRCQLHRKHESQHRRLTRRFLVSRIDEQRRRLQKARL